MESQTPLVRVLLENKEKIIQVGKYNEIEFDKFLKSIIIAEKERLSILERIKQKGSINLEILKNEA